MRITEVFAVVFNAPAFCLFCLMKDTVGSLQLSAQETVTASYQGSVTVSCQYDQKFRENTKYWCKGPIYELCRIVVKTPKNRPSDRTSIADDKEAGVFTVTIHSLTKGDEDMYWCVIARSGRNIHTGVRLQISHTVLTPSPTPTKSSLGNYEISWWATLRWILFILIKLGSAGANARRNTRLTSATRNPQSYR
ncbi:hypothetical protein Q5P01_007992 [Channa striata]|uniref:Immunoglobulin domain-containing protein n=1 Tax=Channa striata TaxID=64152 RepID=A0AA88NDD3_CHASR|nr:hypothetical protein Q5P01_007992 [Channa striata]